MMLFVRIRTAFGHKAPLIIPYSSFVSQSNLPSFPFPRFSTSTKNENNPTIAAAVSHLLMHKYDFSAEAAKQVSSDLSIKTSLQNADSRLSFLKESGFSNAQLESFLNCSPQFLSSTSCLEKTIVPRLESFREFGFSPSEIAGIVAHDPFILRYGSTKITATLSILKSLLGTNERLAKVLRCHRRLFYSDLNETLLPNIEFLKTCGVPMERITNQLYLSSNFFMSQPETIRKSVRKLDEIGVDRTSKQFMKALLVACSLSDTTWELRLKIFKDLGFSADDIVKMLRSQPLAFVTSVQKIEKIKEVLLETGKYDMSCIVNYPQSLMCSVEKRYKPRLQVLKELERRNLINKWPSLATLSTWTDKSFSRRYVEGYEKHIGETIFTKNAIGC